MSSLESIEKKVSALLLNEKKHSSPNLLKELYLKLVNTNIIEYIDRPNFPSNDKIKIIEGLDIKNKTFGTYSKIFNILTPRINEVYLSEERPYRILELAGGLGDLSIGLYEQFLRKSEHNKIEITCSDIVKEYIEIAKEKAEKKDYPIKFKIIDALDLERMNSKEYDIVISLHSIHHFFPSHLAKLIIKSQFIARDGILAIDGKQNPGNFFFMFITAFFPSLFTLNLMYLHDAIISARRMYTMTFLEKLAKTVSPNSKIECKSISLGLISLQVSKEEDFNELL